MLKHKNCYIKGDIFSEAKLAKAMFSPDYDDAPHTDLADVLEDYYYNTSDKDGITF